MRGIAETDSYARLIDDWGSAYEFTYDDDPGNPEPYTAERRDGEGALTAKDPDTLREMVLRNYLERKVPREIAP